MCGRVYCQSDFYHAKSSGDTYCYYCSVVPPAITTTPTDVVVYTGDNYTAQCGATGAPAPVIYYFFNAINITTGVPRVTVSNGVLTLASTTHDDTGPYQCFANNVRAISSALWIVTIRDPGECNV